MKGIHSAVSPSLKMWASSSDGPGRGGSGGRARITALPGCRVARWFSVTQCLLLRCGDASEKPYMRQAFQAGPRGSRSSAPCWLLFGQIFRDQVHCPPPRKRGERVLGFSVQGPARPELPPGGWAVRAAACHRSSASVLPRTGRVCVGPPGPCRKERILWTRGHDRLFPEKHPPSPRGCLPSTAQCLPRVAFARTDFCSPSSVLTQKSEAVVSGDNGPGYKCLRAPLPSGPARPRGALLTDKGTVASAGRSGGGAKWGAGLSPHWAAASLAHL